MQVQLITPEKILFQGDAEMVIAPGTEGEFGVLIGHSPLIATLKEGDVVIEQADKTRQTIHIQNGLAEVTPEHCTLLVEVA